MILDPNPLSMTYVPTCQTRPTNKIDQIDQIEQHHTEQGVDGRNQVGLPSRISTLPILQVSASTRDVLQSVSVDLPRRFLFKQNTSDSILMSCHLHQGVR